jgi:hypothetical protein
MRYLILIFLFSFSSAFSYPRYLIESDAGEIISRKLLSNITRNNTLPQTTPAPHISLAVLTHITPLFGIYGMPLTLHGINFQSDESYIINICDKTAVVSCQASCSYLKLTLPPNVQGICNVSMYNTIKIFTYTVATPRIKMKINIDIDLNNPNEVLIFKNNFKQSLVNSMTSIDNIDQVYICDTCISEVIDRRRLLNKQVEIIFRIVSSTPVLTGIENWRAQQVTDTIQASAAIIDNLQNLQNSTITLLSLNSGNNTIGPVNINTNHDESISGLKKWEITLIIVCSLIYLLGAGSFVLYKVKTKEKRKLKKEIKKNQENMKTTVVNIDSEEIIVHEI